MARYAHALGALPQEPGGTLAVVVAGARAEASLPSVCAQKHIRSRQKNTTDPTNTPSCLSVVLRRLVSLLPSLFLDGLLLLLMMLFLMVLAKAWWREALLLLGPSVGALRLNFVGPEAAGSAAPGQVCQVAVDLGAGRRPGSVTWSTHRSTLGAFWAQREEGEDCGAPSAAARSAARGGGPATSAAPVSLVWLSNPGLGHPAVRDAWAPDLAQLLGRPTTVAMTAAATATEATAALRGGGTASAGGEATAAVWASCSPPRCPVLVTSHSGSDQARDFAAAGFAASGTRGTTGHRERSGAGGGVGGGDSSNYRLTPSARGGSSWPAPSLALAPVGPAPFRSRRAVADPVDGGAVAANWGAFALRAAPAAPGAS
jgi:hypothetical protein